MNYLLKMMLCITLITAGTLRSQNKYEKLYKEVLNGNYASSYEKMLGFSKSSNAYNFMALGYFIDANNTMYSKTKNKQYLDYNLAIFKQILLEDSKVNYNNNKWVMNVQKSNQNAVANGKEHLISEGYFFRYLGEYIYILKKNNIYKEYQSSLQKSLESSFKKWETRSHESNKDNSSLYHRGFHTGANWSVVALYLYEFTGKVQYKSFYETFDKQLSKALTVKIKNGKECYIWNSNYPEKFTTDLKKLRKYPSNVQDVSHGNHVVNYMITSYNLGTGKWNKKDMERLSNTVENLLWIADKKSFSDNVDGTQSTSSGEKGTGWKQSDGWMKLIVFKPSLKEIYESFYLQNQVQINKSPFSLQYISNLL